MKFIRLLLGTTFQRTLRNEIHSGDAGDEEAMTIEEFWQQEPPLMFRRVVESWARAEQIEEEKRAARKAKKAAKDAPEAAIISPEVEAYFTDDPAATKPVGGFWICKICKDAPRKHPDWPNNYKWKTEKGFLNHKCLGGKYA